MKLYELTAAQEAYRAEIAAHIAEMTDPDTGEFLGTETDMATLGALTDAESATEADIEAKAETIGLTIIDMEAEAAAIKAEEQKLAKRRNTLENKAKWLRGYLSSNMVGHKMSTPRFTMTWRTSRAAEVNPEDTAKFIEWAERNADQYLRFKAPEINKVELKKALEAGASIPYAELVTRNNMSIK